MDAHSSSHDTPGMPADVENTATAKVSNDVIKLILKDCKNGQPNKDWGKDRFKNIHPAHRRIIGKKRHEKRAKEYRKLRTNLTVPIPEEERDVDEDEFSRAFFEKCRILREQRQEDEALDAYFREEYADCVIYEVPNLEFQDYEASRNRVVSEEEEQLDFGGDFHVEEVSSSVDEELDFGDDFQVHEVNNNPDEFQLGELVQLALATEHEEALTQSCKKNKMRLADVEATGKCRNQGPILDYTEATTIRGKPEKNWKGAKTALMNFGPPLTSWQDLEAQCNSLQDEVEIEEREFRSTDVASDIPVKSRSDAFNTLMSTKVQIPKTGRNRRLKTSREPLTNFKGTVIYTHRTAELDEAMRRMPLMIHSNNIPKNLLKTRGLKYYANSGLIVFTDDLSLCDQDTIYVIPKIIKYCAEGLLSGRTIPDSISEYQLIKRTYAIKFKMKEEQSLIGFLQSRVRIQKVAG